MQQIRESPLNAAIASRTPGVEPPLSRGGVINLFLKSSDPSGACGGLFEKANFAFNVFVKCPIKQQFTIFPKSTIIMMKNMYKNLWGEVKKKKS